MKKLMKTLKIILGTLVGLIVFYLVEYAMGHLITFLGKIPYLDMVIYWPSAYPIVATVLPPLISINVACLCSDAIGRNTKPLGILLIAYYIYTAILTIASASITWQSALTAVISIMIAFLCLK